MKTWKRTGLKALSIFLCTVPPAAVTIYYFPIWYEVGRVRALAPAISILCFCVSAVPLIRWLSQKIKTPAAWMIWSVMAAVLIVLMQVIEQMVVISVVGAIGNIIGAILWKIANRGEKKE